MRWNWLSWLLNRKNSRYRPESLCIHAVALAVFLGPPAFLKDKEGEQDQLLDLNSPWCKE